MFRLNKLLVKNKDNIIYNVTFLDKDSLISGKPFTTIIIGTNGAGKSYLLSVISDVFRNISNFLNDKKPLSMRYEHYEISYLIDDILYEIQISKNKITSTKKMQKHIDIKELKIPANNLAVSYLLNDKFYFSKAAIQEKDDNGYKYLGIRQASNVAFTNSISKQVQTSLSSLARDNDKINSVRQIFKFLSLDLKFEFVIIPKKILQKKDDLSLNKYVENQIYKSNNRKTNNTSEFRDDMIGKISNKNIKEIIRIIRRFDTVEYVGNQLIGQKYTFDLSQNELHNLYFQESIELKMIYDLRLAEINLVLYKANTAFKFEDASSGEKQILFTLLNLLFRIKDNSLILIDEPEISLHPNWQMMYISCLKEIFQTYNNCHFILATHSHYVVSDLEKESSSIVVLKKEVGDNFSYQNAKLLETDTYAWSAENILYNIFGVRTTRNYYFEMDLRKLMEFIQDKNSDNKKEAIELYYKLLTYSSGKEDPLNVILNSMENYIDEAEKTN